MDANSPGLRFYRSSVRQTRGNGVPILVHGQIEPGRSDFDVIFRCLYPRWKPLCILSEHWRFEPEQRRDMLRHVRGGMIWANGDTSLILHHARVLERRGRSMQEFEGNTLLLYAEPPPETLSWEEYLCIAGHGERSYPAAIRTVLHNFDGIYWEIYSTDPSDLDLLISEHRGNDALQMFRVEFGADFPTPGNRSLQRARG
jgi:hypothetical protein